ncbi:LamG-like jellyroll fold domain-containing protein [Sorangium sp. So ce590]|uniref:LamG-like jellyroll fold domain-containing protein n=1 Tax=Sorangium sp. So ce590 TaxID=3133317 RepID=UPI003F62F7D0
MVRIVSWRWMGWALSAIVPLVALTGGSCVFFSYEDVVPGTGGTSGSAGGSVEPCGQGGGGCGEAPPEGCAGPGSHSSTCLIDDGLIARYFLDAYTSDGQLVDSGPEPGLSLDVVRDGETLTLEGEAGRVGIRWSTLGGNARVEAAFSSTATPPGKLLVSKAELTLEAVVSVTAAAVDGVPSRILYVGTGTGELGKYSLSAGDSDAMGNRELQFHVFVGSQAQFVGQWFIPSGEIERSCVLHLVLNAAEGVVDLYVNGDLRTNVMQARPPADYVFTWAEPTWYLVLGNRRSGGRAFRGSIQYAAVYGKPLTPAQVKANAATLAKSDDGPGM